jgi:hypothetical protein
MSGAESAPPQVLLFLILYLSPTQDHQKNLRICSRPNSRTFSFSLRSSCFEFAGQTERVRPVVTSPVRFVCRNVRFIVLPMLYSNHAGTGNAARAVGVVLGVSAARIAARSTVGSMCQLCRRHKCDDQRARCGHGDSGACGQAISQRG